MKNNIEQIEVRGITIKQALGYIIAIIITTASSVTIYKTIISNYERTDRNVEIIQIDISTNKTKIEKLEAEINNIKLELKAVQVKQDIKSNR